MATVDGLTLANVVHEMQKLVGGKIDRINQPEKDELSIIIRNNGTNYRLLICACPDTCRIHFTEVKKQNPAEAPMFCMLLRKHLCGGKILSVTQPDTDRIVRIEIESTDELYNTDRYILVCELMGRHSNIILTDSQNRILDAMKRVGLSVSQARCVMPNAIYVLPPTEKKENPFFADRENISRAIISGKIDKSLSMKYYGVAPVVVTALCDDCGLSSLYGENLSDDEKDKFIKEFMQILSDIREGKGAFVLSKLGEKEVFLPFLPKTLPCTKYNGSSELFDTYFSERDKKESMHRKAYSLIHAVEVKISRAEKKLAGFEEAIAKEADFDRLRIMGELLMANIYRMKSGDREITVENYYTNPPEKMTIPLDMALPPMKNAQKYFKLYKKAKGARDNALSRREEVTAECEYLYGVLDCIERAESEQELEEIRAELCDGKFIRDDGGKKKRQQKHTKPYMYTSSEGYEIYVGRNNYQNDELTFKIASGRDLWLHVKNMPGSHTIVVNKDKGDIPDKTLVEAATIAARHSSSGKGAKTEVDYTFVRYVKKPPHALPGKVTYTNQQTILVIP